MRKIVGLIMAAGIAVLAGCAVEADPLPVGADQFPTESTITLAGRTNEPKETASSCDVVREALLTGTQADINAAMRQLQTDKSADATAREYAADYLDADGAYADTARDLSVTLIRLYCS